jgi:hypothetical protein
VGTWAGLRPLRAAAAGGVRLEAEPLPREGADGVEGHYNDATTTTTVIHNYGCVRCALPWRGVRLGMLLTWRGVCGARRHGGAGVVTSWGCADEVARLAAEAVRAAAAQPRSLRRRELPRQHGGGVPPLRMDAAAA